METIPQLLELSQLNPNLTLDYDNALVHSRLTDFEKMVPESGLSIKMVVRGEEHYIIGDQHLTITPSRYLIVNKYQKLECFIKSTKVVEAFCIYLNPDLLAEVYHNLTSSQESRLDIPYTPPKSLHLLERAYHITENQLGHYLEQLKPMLLSTDTRQHLDYQAIFYSLCEKVLQSHANLNSQLQQLPATKSATRVELSRRLSIAYSFIHDNFDSAINLDEIAQQAMLSKYHLLRSYKQVYGVTPYQHALQRRLLEARQRLKVEEGTALEIIAFESGFSDRRAFTKAFKKAYGMPPSAFRTA